MRGTSPCPSPQGCLEEAALTWISCRGKNELKFFFFFFKENVGGIISVVEWKKCWARRNSMGTFSF